MGTGFVPRGGGPETWQCPDSAASLSLSFPACEMGVITRPGPGQVLESPSTVLGGGQLRPTACLQDILEWKTARSFLYWRLRRLLLESQVKQEVLRACPELSYMHVQSMLRRWFVETEGAVKVGLGQRCAGVGGGPRGRDTWGGGPRGPAQPSGAPH